MEGKEKQRLLKYVNSKLSECLGISISRDNTHKRDTFSIEINFIKCSIKDIVKSIFDINTSENIISYMFPILL